MRLVTALYMGMADRPALQPDRTACHGHLAQIEGLPGAADATAYHDGADFGAAQQGMWWQIGQQDLQPVRGAAPKVGPRGPYKKKEIQTETLPNFLPVLLGDDGLGQQQADPAAGDGTDHGGAAGVGFKVVQDLRQQNRRDLRD